MRLSIAFLCCVAAIGCADPCADVSGTPALTLAGSNQAGDTIEPFDDGGDRPLIAGPQGGMHVWLFVRMRGICPTEAQVDRRVLVDATDEIVDVQRGPGRFVQDEEPGTFVTTDPFTMFMCPAARTIIGERFRFSVRVEDADGLVAMGEKPFVAACVAGTCDLCGSL